METWPKVVKALKEADQLKDEFSIQNTVLVLQPFALELFEKFQDTAGLLNIKYSDSYASYVIGFGKGSHLHYPYEIWPSQTLYGDNFLYDLQQRLLKEPEDGKNPIIP